MQHCLTIYLHFTVCHSGVIEVTKIICKGASGILSTQFVNLPALATDGLPGFIVGPVKLLDAVWDTGEAVAPVRIKQLKVAADSKVLISCRAIHLNLESYTDFSKQIKDN